LPPRDRRLRRPAAAREGEGEEERERISEKEGGREGE